MENKKKAKLITQPSFVSSRCMVVVVLSNNFGDDSSYVYPNVLRYYRKCFWNSKSKLAASPNGDKSLVPLEIESAAVSTQLLQVWTLASQKNRPCLWLLLLSRHTVSSRCTYRSAMGWSCHFARQV